MRQHLFTLVVCLVSAATMDAAMAQGMGQEHPYAAHHIDGLPADVRRAVVSHEGACGGKAAATHYFATSIATPNLSFISLHFETFSCPNRSTLCTAAGCLHEIYTGMGMNYRRVFSVYAGEVDLTNADGVAGREVRRGSTTQLYRWNGSRFAPVRP